MDVIQFYDDQAECSLQGIFRQANLKDKHIPKINLIPNPANESVEIYFKGYQIGLCRLLVSNTMKKKILTIDFDCSNEFYKLNTSKLSPGIYSIEFIINNIHIGTEKLVIVR